MSLQSRFILLYGVGGSFFLALITLLTVIGMENQMLERLREQFDADAKLNMQAIQRNLLQHSAELQLSASIPVFQAMRLHQLTLDESASRNDIQQLETYFRNRQSQQADLLQIRYFNAAGTELLRAGDADIARDSEAMPASAEARSALMPAPGEFAITLDVKDGQAEHIVWWIPVHSSTQSAQGLISFVFSFDLVRRQVMRLAQDSRKQVCLTGEDEVILAGNNTGQKHCWNPQLGHWQVREIIKLSGVTWHLQLSADPAYYLKDLYRLRWLVFGVFFPLITLVNMLVVYFVTCRLVKPLRQVSWRLQHLAEGNLQLPDIRYNGCDEITDLIESSQRLKNGMEASIAQANAIAAGDYSQQARLLSEHDQLGKALADMTRKLDDMSREQAADNWMKAAFAKLNETTRGAQSVEKLSNRVLSMLVKQLDATVGLFFFYDSNDAKLKLSGRYAYDLSGTEVPREFEIGEGLVGQTAAEKQMMIVGNVPQDYIRLNIGVGCIVPRVLLLLPLVHKEKVRGVIELGACHDFKELEIEFLKRAAPVIAIELYAATSRSRLEKLLKN